MFHWKMVVTNKPQWLHLEISSFFCHRTWIVKLDNYSAAYCNRRGGMVKDWLLYKIFRYVFRVRADMNTAKSLGNLAISLLLSNEEGMYQPNLLQLNVKNPFTDRLWGDIFWKLFFTSDNKKISCWFIYMSNLRFGIFFLLN